MGCVFGLGWVDCVLWLDWLDAGLELAVALLVLWLALLLVGADVVVDDRTGEGLDEVDERGTDEWGVDGAGRVVTAVLDATEVDAALDERECVEPGGPAWVELAGSD